METALGALVSCTSIILVLGGVSIAGFVSLSNLATLPCVPSIPVRLLLCRARVCFQRQTIPLSV